MDFTDYDFGEFYNNLITAQARTVTGADSGLLLVRECAQEHYRGYGQVYH